MCVMLPAFLIAVLVGVSLCSYRRYDPTSLPIPSKQHTVRLASAPLVVVMLINSLLAIVASKSSVWDWCTPKSSGLMENAPWVNFWHTSLWVGTRETLQPQLYLLQNCSLASHTLIHFSQSLSALEVGLVPTEYLMSEIIDLLKWGRNAWIIMATISISFFLANLLIAHKCVNNQAYQPVDPNPNPHPNSNPDQAADPPDHPEPNESVQAQNSNPPNESARNPPTVAFSIGDAHDV